MVEVKSAQVGRLEGGSSSEGQPGLTNGDSRRVANPGQGAPGSGKARAWARKYLVVMLVPLLLVIFSFAAPDTFARWQTMRTMLSLNAALLILVVGQTLVFAVGEFDLSFAGLTGMAGAMVVAFPDMPLAASLLISLAAVLCIGLINSFFVVGLGVSSLIATLGMGTVTTGIGLAATGSAQVPNPYDNLGDWLRASLGGIGVSFIGGLVLVALLWVVLERTLWGRNAYFVGVGRKAAAYAGIPVNRTRVLAFLISALAAWAAGIVLLAFSGSADATFGSGYILNVFAAVFLGYTAIRPGRYNAIGSLIGVLVLMIGSTGLGVLAAPIWVTDIFSGSILFVSVALANVLGNPKGIKALRSPLEG